MSELLPSPDMYTTNTLPPGPTATSAMVSGLLLSSEFTLTLGPKVSPPSNERAKKMSRPVVRLFLGSCHTT